MAIRGIAAHAARKLIVADAPAGAGVASCQLENIAGLGKVACVAAGLAQINARRSGLGAEGESQGQGCSQTRDFEQFHVCLACVLISNIILNVKLCRVKFRICFEYR